MTVSVAKINLERCYRKPEFILKTLGYKKHTKGYIKPHKDGRFHAIPFGDEIELHFDVTVDNKHMVLPSDYILPHEISRFKHRISKFLKTVKEDKPKEFKIPPLNELRGIKTKSQMKKDLKKIHNREKKIEEIKKVVATLGYVPSFLKDKVRAWKIEL